MGSEMCIRDRDAPIEPIDGDDDDVECNPSDEQVSDSMLAAAPFAVDCWFAAATLRRRR